MNLSKNKLFKCMTKNCKYSYISREAEFGRVCPLCGEFEFSDGVDVYREQAKFGGVFTESKRSWMQPNEFPPEESL